MKTNKKTHYMRAPNIINSPKTFESWNSNCKLKMCYKQWNIVSVYLIKYFTTMELLVFRKCFSIYVCMYVCMCGTRDCFFSRSLHLLVLVFVYLHLFIYSLNYLSNAFCFKPICIFPVNCICLYMCPAFNLKMWNFIRTNKW